MAAGDERGRPPHHLVLLLLLRQGALVQLHLALLGFRGRGSRREDEVGRPAADRVGGGEVIRIVVHGGLVGQAAQVRVADRGRPKSDVARRERGVVDRVLAGKGGLVVEGLGEVAASEKLVLGNRADDVARLVASVSAMRRAARLAGEALG